MNSYYITVVVHWLASVHSKCKDDGSNPVSVISYNCQTVNVKEFISTTRQIIVDRRNFFLFFVAWGIRATSARISGLLRSARQTELQPISV